MRKSSSGENFRKSPCELGRSIEDFSPLKYIAIPHIWFVQSNVYWGLGLQTCIQKDLVNLHDTYGNC